MVYFDHSFIIPRFSVSITDICNLIIQISVVPICTAIIHYRITQVTSLDSVEKNLTVRSRRDLGPCLRLHSNYLIHTQVCETIKDQNRASRVSLRILYEYKYFFNFLLHRSENKSIETNFSQSLLINRERIPDSLNGLLLVAVSKHFNGRSSFHCAKFLTEVYLFVYLNNKWSLSTKSGF